MKRVLLLFIVITNCYVAIAESSTITAYTKKTYMIRMRDGVQLNTVVFSPSDVTASFPILIQRTPYGADKPNSYDPLKVSYISEMAKEGYIFVFQDIRGKFKSEGI